VAHIPHFFPNAKLSRGLDWMVDDEGKLIVDMYIEAQYGWRLT
jgi:hypothetical protein